MTELTSSDYQRHERLIGEPFEIDGQRVVLVEDHAGDDPRFETPALLSAETEDHPSLWVDEEVVLRTRHDYPDAAIYGLWQTLYASGLIDGDFEILAVPLGERSGLYLAQTEAGLTSGRYMAGQIPERPLDGLDVATFLNVHFEQLILPDEVALLASERGDLKAKELRRVWALRGGIAAVIVLALAAVDWGLSARSNAQKEQLQSLNAQLNSRYAEYRGLQKGRIDGWPDQRQPMAPLVVLSSLAPNLSTLADDQLSMDSARGAVIVPEGTDLSGLPNLFSKSYRQDGTVIVSWGGYEH